MENITSVIVGAASVIGAVLAALLGGLTIWAFRDIRSRTRDILVQILATILVGVVPIAGILVYLMLRPKETLSEGYVRALEEESLLSSIENQEFCPTCGRRVDADMHWCPSCHTKLRNACGNCGKAVHLSWDMCPYCGTGLQPELPNVSKPGLKPVAAPKPAPRAKPVAVAAPAAVIPAALPQAKEAVGSVLDRFGGVVGSVVDRVNARIQNTGATPVDEVEKAVSRAATEPEMEPVKPQARPEPPVPPVQRVVRPITHSVNGASIDDAKAPAEPELPPAKPPPPSPLRNARPITGNGSGAAAEEAKRDE
jgi:RNA polymerase subunit RPABC4/transcription elongation factor Spt4